MDPSKFMHANVSRRRLWVPHMNKGFLDSLQNPDDMFLEYLGIFMHAFSPPSLEHMMLPDADELMKRELFHSEGAALFSPVRKPKALWLTVASGCRATKYMSGNCFNYYLPGHLRVRSDTWFWVN